MATDATDDQSHRPDEQLSLTDVQDRADRMRDVVDGWVEDLIEGIQTTRASEQFQRWLDAQSRLHDYSYRNTLLIHRQCPGATRVAGYRTWQQEFDRQVQEGESAIWIWAPITAPACPDCGNSPSYTDHADCTYETPQDDWETDVVGFKPVPVFDVSQTEGEPIPELDTDARTGNADPDALLDRLLDAHDTLGVDVELVAPTDWRYGRPTGVCEYGDRDDRPRVAVEQRSDPAAVAGTLCHEYAHALLHGTDGTTERETREVEAEAVAYIAGRRFGLDTDASACYLAAWDGDAVETVKDRLQRIGTTARQLVAAVPETTQ
jgi:hypothetical protein